AEADQFRSRDQAASAFRVPNHLGYVCQTWRERRRPKEESGRACHQWFRAPYQLACCCKTCSNNESFPRKTRATSSPHEYHTRQWRSWGDNGPLAYPNGYHLTRNTSTCPCVAQRVSPAVPSIRRLGR